MRNKQLKFSRSFFKKPILIRVNIVSIKLCAIAFIFKLERIVIAKLQKLRQNMDDTNILTKMLAIIKADGDEEGENIANDRGEDKYRDKNLFVMSGMLTGRIPGDNEDYAS